MLVVESRTLNLPPFSLRRESTGRIGKLLLHLAFKDIELRGYEDFNSTYFLEGKAEEEVRAAFHHQVVQFLEQNQSEYGTYSIEGAGNRLLLYRNGIRVSTEELDVFLELGTRLTRAFEK